jgi:pfkB family carbohydrate kinase
MARSLGARVTLVTALTPSYDRCALEGIQLCAQPADDLPRYANSYDASGARTQLLLASGPPLDVEAPAIPREADVLMVAPAFNELRRMPPVKAPLVAVALQGLLRAVDAGHHVYPDADPWGRIRRFLAPGRFTFLSEEDTPTADSLAAEIASSGATCILTRAERGATLFRSHIKRQFTAIPAQAQAPTGAGDCFATAFIIRFAECGDIETAMRFATAAGSAAVDIAGPGNVPTRDEVEARLRKAAA